MKSAHVLMAEPTPFVPVYWSLDLHRTFSADASIGNTDSWSDADWTSKLQVQDDKVISKATREYCLPRCLCGACITLRFE